jgi:DNA-binding CsgD family transcriptional regulator/PAS domain-containing protein
MHARTFNARDAVIERIYSAAGGLNAWDDALAQLSSYCGATASYINLLSEPNHTPFLVGAFGHAPRMIERYRTYGYLIDPTTSQIIASAGEPISFSDLSRRELGSPAFHREFIASRGTDQVLAIGLASEIGILLVKLSRDATGRPFTLDSAEKLEGIADHVRQAVVIDRSRRRRVEAESFAATIVNRLRAGVVRIDDRLKVTFANQAAYRLAKEEEVISITDCRLRFVEHEAMESLRHFLRKASATDRDLSETMLLTSSSQGRRVRVWAWSTKRENQNEIGLVILPDDYDADVLEAMLHENYGLTPSEIRTAVGVLSYSGLAAVAENTGVSVETVRFHMKRIFSKTGTRRQAELVRVIANDLCIDPEFSPASPQGFD